MGITRTRTRTFATLEISKAAFDEISEKMKAAGYDHAFLDHGNVVDMEGIAVAKVREPRSQPGR